MCLQWYISSWSKCHSGAYRKRQVHVSIKLIRVCQSLMLAKIGSVLNALSYSGMIVMYYWRLSS